MPFQILSNNWNQIVFKKKIDDRIVKKKRWESVVQ